MYFVLRIVYIPAPVRGNRAVGYRMSAAGTALVAGTRSPRNGEVKRNSPVRRGNNLYRARYGPVPHSQGGRWDLHGIFRRIHVCPHNGQPYQTAIGPLQPYFPQFLILMVFLYVFQYRSAHPEAEVRIRWRTPKTYSGCWKTYPTPVGC
jgi:hypothetical protein